MNTLTTPGQEAERPWPVVLLTALGAWLATIPLAGVVGLLLGNLMAAGIGPYVTGTLLLIGASVLLRASGVSLFVEQMAVPVLLLGGVTLGFGLYRDLSPTLASLLLALTALGIAALIRAAWLQVLLAATACTLVLAAAAEWHGVLRGNLGMTAQACVLLWAVLAGWRNRPAALQYIATGWMLAALAALAFSSGMTFLAGAMLDLRTGGVGGWSALSVVRSGWSVALAAGSGGLLLWRWPELRQIWAFAAIALGMGLAWWMPALGAAWLVAALCATTGRPRQAAAAGVAAVWIIGAFYYQLTWPLATKAAVLAGTGAGLGLLAWWGQRSTRPVGATTATPAAEPARWGIALCAALVLVVINLAIWQKESLISQGRAVFVELAPVDPRSLMQGDYMALNYQMAAGLREQLSQLDTLERPVVLAEVDARGVARLQQLEAAANPTAASPAAASASSLRLQLTPKHGRWILVSDAWFFKEGDGARWQAARYGEFRVMPDGRALLVGLADAQLQPIAAH